MSRYACCDEHGLSRRDLLKGVAAGAVTAASPLAATAAKEGKKMTTTETMGQAPVAACKKVAADAPGAKAKVYFSRKIDAQTLIDLYERINKASTARWPLSCTPAKRTVLTFCPETW